MHTADRRWQNLANPDYWDDAEIYVTTIVAPLLSVGEDQASNVFRSTNPDASVYAEYLDSIRDGDDIKQTIAFLNQLNVGNAL